MKSTNCQKLCFNCVFFISKIFRGDRNFAPNVTLDPAPYKNLHDMYDDDGDEDDEGEDCDEKESVMADKDATTKQSHRWLSMLTSLGNSAVHLASKPGTVSDDESDDSESVLSDKRRHLQVFF